MGRDAEAGIIRYIETPNAPGRQTRHLEMVGVGCWLRDHRRRACQISGGDRGREASSDLGFLRCEPKFLCNPQERPLSEVVQFVSKSDLERARLIREARAIYESIFPAANRLSKSPTGLANRQPG